MSHLACNGQDDSGIIYSELGQADDRQEDGMMCFLRRGCTVVFLQVRFVNIY